MKKRPSYGSVLHALVPGRKSVLALVISILALWISIPQTTPVTAAINEQLNFQARLLTAAGGLVADGYYHVRFKIYCGGDGDTVGAGTGTDCTDAENEQLLWTETWTTGNLVRVANGYLSAQLGSVNATLGSAVDWTQGELYLSIEIGGSSGSASWDGEMDPFMRLTSVPYAFSANNLDGLDSSEFVQLGQNSTQTVNSTGDAVSFNQTGSGGLINIQQGGTSYFSINNSGATTLGGTLAVRGASVTVGASSGVNGSIYLYDGQTGGNENTIRLQASASMTANLTFVLPTADGTTNQCLATNGSGVLSFIGCGGSVNLQQAYDNSTGSTTPEIILDSTRVAVDIQNNNSAPITGSLLAVRDNTVSGLGDVLFAVQDDAEVFIGGNNNAGTISISDGDATADFVSIVLAAQTASRTLTIPTMTSNDSFCLAALGNCSAAAPTLQAAYNNSVGGTTPEVKLDSTRGSIDIQDADTTIGADLLTVRASNGAGLGQLLFSVDTSGVQIGNGDNTGIDLLIAKENTATSGSPYNSNRIVLQGSAYDTDGAAAVDRDITFEVITQDTNNADYRLAILNDSGTEFVTFDGYNQRLGVGTSSPASLLEVTGQVLIDGSADESQLVIEANATQTAPLIVARDSNGNELIRITAPDNDTISIGFNAGTNSYDNNIAIGKYALSGAEDGNSNIAIGNYALDALTSSSAGTNIAIGEYALSENTTGYSNLAIGYESLTFSTDGINNSAIGYQSGMRNTTGNRNTYFGVYSSDSNKTGSDNVALGYGAGRGTINQSFDRSVSIGSQAGYSVSTGSNNIFLGYQAGYNNTSGSNNIAIGYDIDVQSATGSNQLSIGNIIFGTGVDGTGTTISSGSIGIGLTAPSSRLQVNGALTVGDAGNTNGTIILERVANSNSISIAIADQTVGSATVTVPNLAGSNDTFCLLSLGNCAGVATTLQGAYNNDADGSDAVISLTSTDGAVVLRDAASTIGNLFVIEADGGTDYLAVTATETTVNGDLVVTAGNYISLAGGNTASRPGSPTEGMVYFDTDTDRLMVYANGKWQTDNREAILVAASNSSQADKDAADYVADGNTVAANDGDQVQINSALTAASGRKVVLLAGTYVADATILIPNNTTLAGVGNGTIIELADLDATENLIENSDTTTGTGVVIRDMRLDGRSDLNTAGTQNGIYLYGMGSGVGVRNGGLIINNVIEDFRTYAVLLEASHNSKVESNILQRNSYGITLNLSSSNNSIVNNTIQDTEYGVGLFSDNLYNTISDNVIQDADQYGIYISTSSYSNVINSNTVQNSVNGIGMHIASSNNTISDNLIQDLGQNVGLYLTSSSTSNSITNNNIVNVGNGIWLQGSDRNIVDGNSIDGTVYEAINLLSSANENLISNNRIHNSFDATDNNGVFIGSSDFNSITNNVITDTSCDTTCYAINISSATSDKNYLEGNRYSDTDADAGDDAAINDAGTGTIYAGQSTGTTSGTDVSNFTFRGANSTTAFAIQNAAGASIFNVDTTNAEVEIGNATTAGRLVVSDGSSNTATILVQATAGDYTFTIPTVTANDTFCLATLGNCAGTAVTLQGAYNNDADGSDAVITLSTADESVIIRNPAASGTDSAFVLQVENLATANTTNNFITLDINAGGTFDTTAGNLTNYGLDINSSASESAGGNTLTNIGLNVNVSGADANYAALFSGGNVGIGTSSPTSLLEVAGQILIDGSADENQLIIEANATQTSPLILSRNSAGTELFRVTTRATDSIYIGNAAGNANTVSSNENTALGYQALYATDSGDNNTAIGSATLRANTDGYANTAVGWAALYGNVSGFENTAVGSNALYRNTGSYNVALGTNAGLGNVADTIINYNVLIGHSSGYNLRTDNNTMVGYSAGILTSTGANNLFLGYQVGDNNTSGSNNIAIGYDVDVQNATSSNQLTIGNLIFGSGGFGTGTTVGTGNIGIGVANPDGRLEVGGNQSAAAWGLNGIQLQASTATYTDSSTAASGTATNSVFTSFGRPTLAATNASVTTTNAATVYIQNSPLAGTNQTITNAYALWVDDGTARFDGNVTISGNLNNGFTTGSVVFQGASGFTQDNANFFWDDTNNMLGLGTANPDGDGFATLQLNISGPAGNDAGISFQADVSGTPVQGIIRANDATGYVDLAATTNSPIVIYTNALTRAIFPAAGGFVVGPSVANNSFSAIEARGSGQNFALNPGANGTSEYEFRENDVEVAAWRFDSSVDRVYFYDDVNNVERVTFNLNGNVGIGTTGPGAKLDISGTASATEWGLNGIALQIDPATYTDTSSSGTVSNVMFTSLGQPTVTSSGGTATYTNAATMYIQNAPITSGDETITNAYGLYIDGGSGRTTAYNEYGMYVDIDDTGIVTSGTDLTVGSRIDVNRTGATGGTINNVGLDIDVTDNGSGAGTSTNIGLDVNVSGADTNYAAIFQGGNVGIGNTAPSSLLQVNGALTVGDAGSTNGTIIFENAANSNSVTLTLTNQTVGSATLTIPNLAGVNDTLCLATLNNCAAAVTLQGAYGNDADGSDAVINLSTADDSLIFRNPAASGSDSAYVLTVDQLATGAGNGGLNIGSAGGASGYALRVNDDGTLSDTTPFVIDNSGNVGVGSTNPDGQLEIAGNISKSAWGANGVQLQVSAATLTDSDSVTGTVALAVANSFAASTLDAINTVTYTDAATVYIQGAPTAGGDETITNAYALWVDNGNVRFDGNIASNLTQGSIVFVGLNGLLTQDNSNFYFDSTSRELGIGTNSPNGQLHITSSGDNTRSRIRLEVTGNGSNQDALITFADPTESGDYYSIGLDDTGDRLTISASEELGTSNLLTVTSAGNVGIGIDGSVSILGIDGDRTLNAWGTTGTQIGVLAGTFTDNSTAASGTATYAFANSVRQATFAAANSNVTTTNAATLWIEGAPLAGTNQTLTNTYAIWADSGLSRFDAGIELGVGSATNGLLRFKNATNNFVVTLNAPNQTGGSATFSFPDTGGVSDTICLLTLNNCAGTGNNLQQSYDADVDGGNATIQLTAADDSIVISNPTSAGTDSTFVVRVEQLNTGTYQEALVVDNAGTGLSFRVNDAGSGDTTPFVVDAAGLVGIGTSTPTDLLTISGGNVLLTANSTALTDGSNVNSGDVTLRGYFDSDTGAGVTATSRIVTLRNTTAYNAGTGASRLSVLNNSGTEFASFHATNNSVDIGGLTTRGLLRLSDGDGVNPNYASLQAATALGSNLTFTLPSAYGTAGFCLKDTDGAGTLGFGDCNTGAITGSSTNGYVTFWTGSSSISGETELFWDNTNKRLGLGLTGPSTLLQVDGALTVGDAGLTDGSLIFERAANSLIVTVVAANQTTASSTLTIPNANGVNDTFCLANLGNCGGSGGGVTTSGGTTNYLPRFTGAQTIGDSAIYDDGTDIHLARTGDARLTLDADTGNGADENANPELLFRQDSLTERMRIGLNGDVNNQFSGALQDGGYVYLSNAADLQVGSNTTGLLMTILDTGNVGIGNINNPAYKLQVLGAIASGDANTRGQLVLFDNDAGASTVTIQAGNFSSDLTFTWPTTVGTTGDCIKTDGSGGLSFGACGTGVGSSYTQGSVIFANSSNSLTEDNSNFYFDDSNDFLGIGLGSSLAARLQVSDGGTYNSWGLNGIAIRQDAATWTNANTAASGTATNAVFVSFGTPTLAASNTNVTTTNASTVYIAGPPTAGTNQTITNAYALWLDSGRLRVDSSNPFIIKPDGDGGNILTISAPTGISSDYTYTLPSATGTFCLTTGNCSGVGGNGDVLLSGNTVTGDVILGNNSTAGSNDRVVLETANTGRIYINEDGSINFQHDAANTAIFQLFDTSSSTLTLLEADSSNDRILIGDSTADGTGVLLVLDSKNTSGDPTGTNGATYYNSSTGKFRCYEDGSWKNCSDPDDVNIAFAPQFPNAIVTTNVNVLTTFNNVTGLSSGQGWEHNYYNFNGQNGSLNSVSVVVRYRIPDNFNSFTSNSFMIWRWADSTNTANANLQYSMRDKDGTLCNNLDALLPSATNTWEQATLNNPSGSCTFAGGDVISFIFVVNVKNSTNVRLGEFEFIYGT